MKKLNVFSAFIFCFLFLFSAFAQEPQHSPKLDKEKGFNALKIRAPLTAVKSILQKDTIPKKDSWEPTEGGESMDGISEIYLVDPTKPEYKTFMGKDVARIEVYISPDFGENKTPIVWDVKIFFKKISTDDFKKFFDKLFTAYGPASLVLDVPRKGDQIDTWYSEDVLMSATSFIGGMGELKDAYFMVSFSSELV
jgi:hypothetical protein